MMTEETQLIEGLKMGKASAINQLVNKYTTFVYAICFQVLRNKFEAEEASQDSLMKAMRSIGSFQNESSFKPWLYAIAFRTAIDYKRRQKLSVDIEQITSFASDNETDQAINKAEEHRIIHAALNRLNEDDRYIVTLYYLDELSIKEVAEIVHMTESNIKVKLFRARKELSLILNQKETI